MTCLLVAGLGSVAASVAVYSAKGHGKDKELWVPKLWKRVQSSMNVRVTKRLPLKSCRFVGKRRYRCHRRRACSRARRWWILGLMQYLWVLLYHCWSFLFMPCYPPRHPVVALNTMLRGGGSAGGSKATKRKRAEKQAQQRALSKLCALLQPLLGNPSPPVTGGGGKKKRKKKKKPTTQQDTPVAQGPVDKLSQVVERIKAEPSTMVSRLETFLSELKASPPTSTSSKPVNKTWAGVVKSTPPPDKAGQKIQSHTTLAKQCWGIGEIKDFSEVSRKIEQREEPGGSIALAPSVNHALDLRQLALGHKMNHLKFACVVLNGNLSNSSGHATMITLPVNVGQTVKFQRMACVFLGDDKPVLPTNLVQEVATVPAKRALATVRIHVPRNFVSSEHWKLWTKTPAHMLQDWSAQAKPVHASYGWTTTNQTNLHGSEDFVLGYAKIDVGHVQEFLALRSGWCFCCSVGQGKYSCPCFLGRESCLERHGVLQQGFVNCCCQQNLRRLASWRWEQSWL